MKLAADHGVLLSVKGGGHNIAGTSIAPGGLTLDMSLMRTVHVDPAARIAHVGAGCLLKHVDAATQEHGLAAVLGLVSETGVAGLTLGGGFGYLTRRCGWTVDSLEAVDIVTAEGQVRTAKRDEEPELFWALRGGGGNFGVVTRFTFRLFEVGPVITGGLIAWSAKEISRSRHSAKSRRRSSCAWLRRHLRAPRVARPADRGHGRVSQRLRPRCRPAPRPKHGQPRRRRDHGEALHRPAGDARRHPAEGPQPLLEERVHPDLLARVPNNVVRERPSADVAMSQTVAGFHIGGALNERHEEDGAVGNRDARYVAAIAACWPPGDERAEEHLAWARRSWEAVRPFSTGGNYVNFQVSDLDTSRTAAAYRADYERLQRAKATYDPHNFFRVNRNVPPRG